MMNPKECLRGRLAEFGLQKRKTEDNLMAAFLSGME